VRATRVEIGAGNYVLLSFPRARDVLDALTAAERHVALAVLAGLSNGEVAQMRGSSPRTIANQVATIFRKLAVRSRAELAVLVTAPARDGAPPRRA
jgi:DNA-binding NarL/FixJ family response regulator